MPIHKAISRFMDRPEWPTVGPEAQVREAIDAMASGAARCVFVVERDRLKGIVTDRDVLFRVLAAGKDPDATPVREVMTARPETLKPEDSVAYAMNCMAVGGYRNVPIVDGNGRLAGCIGTLDVVNHLSEVLAETESDLPTDSYDIGGGG